MQPRLQLLAATCLLAAACAQKPATFVPGEKMEFPVYSDAVIADLGERMVQMCERDADPNDPGCVARVQERRASCRAADTPEVFATSEQYREYAKQYLYCIDRL
jgi:hypothetical protein